MEPLLFVWKALLDRLGLFGVRLAVELTIAGRVTSTGAPASWATREWRPSAPTSSAWRNAAHACQTAGGGEVGGTVRRDERAAR